ncbi:fatty acid desaturase [Sphingopyxis microcysteis]|uniref:fatty acid desaturase n=1 Tax=Sphingopyxis microcysteis TaxID=2484145 RepID=UPI001447BCE0|nr:fatty acid desaturase [Sphingopyxis microcysteis]
MSTSPQNAAAQFNALRSCPRVAWPTVALFVVCTSIIGGVWYAAIAHGFPLWLGAIVNGVTAYYLFSVVHDSSHNAVSKIKWVNELLGRIGLVYFAPLAPMDVARYIHMAHHKYANDPERDPDGYAHKLDMWFPLRWLNFDYYYTKWFFQKGGDFARRKYPALFAYVAFILSTCALIIWLGYGLELLMLWFIPTRISSFLFVLVFSFLTHQPFETYAKEDEYKATALRMGGEWILSPLMANHNYHLIHHLYPTAPFYNYIKIMKLRGDEILARDPLMPPTFGLSPRTKELANH